MKKGSTGLYINISLHVWAIAFDMYWTLNTLDNAEKKALSQKSHTLALGYLATYIRRVITLVLKEILIRVFQVEARL